MLVMLGRNKRQPVVAGPSSPASSYLSPSPVAAAAADTSIPFKYRQQQQQGVHPEFISFPSSYSPSPSCDGVSNMDNVVVPTTTSQQESSSVMMLNLQNDGQEDQDNHIHGSESLHHDETTGLNIRSTRIGTSVIHGHHHQQHHQQQLRQQRVQSSIQSNHHHHNNLQQQAMSSVENVQQQQQVHHQHHHLHSSSVNPFLLQSTSCQYDLRQQLTQQMIHQQQQLQQQQVVSRVSPSEEEGDHHSSVSKSSAASTATGLSSQALFLHNQVMNQQLIRSSQLTQSQIHSAQYLKSQLNQQQQQLVNMSHHQSNLISNCYNNQRQSAEVTSADQVNCYANVQQFNHHNHRVQGRGGLSNHNNLIVNPVSNGYATFNGPPIPVTGGMVPRTIVTNGHDGSNGGGQTMVTMTSNGDIYSQVNYGNKLNSNNNKNGSIQQHVGQQPPAAMYQQQFINYNGHGHVNSLTRHGTRQDHSFNDGQQQQQVFQNGHQEQQNELIAMLDTSSSTSSIKFRTKKKKKPTPFKPPTKPILATLHDLLQVNGNVSSHTMTSITNGHHHHQQVQGNASPLSVHQPYNGLSTTSMNIVSNVSNLHQQLPANNSLHCHPHLTGSYQSSYLINHNHDAAAPKVPTSNRPPVPIHRQQQQQNGTANVSKMNQHSPSSNSNGSSKHSMSSLNKITACLKTPLSVGNLLSHPKNHNSQSINKLIDPLKSIIPNVSNDGDIIMPLKRLPTTTTTTTTSNDTNGPQSLVRPKCTNCTKVIIDEECTEAEGGVYHIKCFICTNCSDPLGGCQYIMARDGNDCSQDGDDGVQQQVINYNGDECIKVSKPLLMPFCTNCYDSLFGEFCEGCGELIQVSKGSAISHDNRSWHATDTCFNCYNCSAPLIGKPFLPHSSGLIFCSLICSKEAFKIHNFNSAKNKEEAEEIKEEEEAKDDDDITDNVINETKDVQQSPTISSTSCSSSSSCSSASSSSAAVAAADSINPVTTSKPIVEADCLLNPVNQLNLSTLSSTTTTQEVTSCDVSKDTVICVEATNSCNVNVVRSRIPILVPQGLEDEEEDCEEDNLTIGVSTTTTVTRLQQLSQQSRSSAALSEVLEEDEENISSATSSSASSSTSSSAESEDEDVTDENEKEEKDGRSSFAAKENEQEEEKDPKESQEVSEDVSKINVSTDDTAIVPMTHGDVKHGEEEENKDMVIMSKERRDNHHLLEQKKGKEAKEMSSAAKEISAVSLLRMKFEKETNEITSFAPSSTSSPSVPTTTGHDDDGQAAATVNLITPDCDYDGRQINKKKRVEGRREKRNQKMLQQKSKEEEEEEEEEKQKMIKSVVTQPSSSMSQLKKNGHVTCSTITPDGHNDDREGQSPSSCCVQKNDEVVNNYTNSSSAAEDTSLTSSDNNATTSTVKVSPLPPNEVNVNIKSPKNVTFNRTISVMDTNGQANGQLVIKSGKRVERKHSGRRSRRSAKDDESEDDDDDIYDSDGSSTTITDSSESSDTEDDEETKSPSVVGYASYRPAYRPAVKR